MKHSYWEIKEWFTNVDFTIVGSGIVGLNCALNLKTKFPKAKILVLEKGMLPQGASSKNAGFACFGSLSELIDDLENHTEEEVFNLVQKRWDGLQLLRKNLGNKAIDFQQNKGYELFTNADFYNECLEQKEKLNQLLKPLFKESVFREEENIFNFKGIHNNYIANVFEGQIDTGKMITELLRKVSLLGIKILNNTTVTSFEDLKSKVLVNTDQHSFYTSKLLIATNGFAKDLVKEKVNPARAQVLITKPIKNLSIKGTFHLEKGYYYFRNIDDRILLGGGRNLDFKTEETTNFDVTSIIQEKLLEILSTIILPDTNFTIDFSWSGIMGVGNQKKAIVKQLSNNVYCGVRLGGMGVAIGGLIGKELSELLYED
jgi:gamma-glutamylputrescine oxidase